MSAVVSSLGQKRLLLYSCDSLNLSLAGSDFHATKKGLFVLNFEISPFDKRQRKDDSVGIKKKSLGDLGVPPAWGVLFSSGHLLGTGTRIPRVRCWTSSCATTWPGCCTCARRGKGGPARGPPPRRGDHTLLPAGRGPGAPGREGRRAALSLSCSGS